MRRYYFRCQNSLKNLSNFTKWNQCFWECRPYQWWSKTYIWTTAKFSLEARKIVQGCVFKVGREKKKKKTHLCVADRTLHGNDKYMCTCTGQEMFLGIRQFSSIHLKVVKEKISDFFFSILDWLTTQERINTNLGNN